MGAEYVVKYKIDLDASGANIALGKFVDNVNGLAGTGKEIATAVNGISRAHEQIELLFKKLGNRKTAYKLKIDTGKSLERLTSINGRLDKIKSNVEEINKLQLQISSAGKIDTSGLTESARGAARNAIETINAAKAAQKESANSTIERVKTATAQAQASINASVAAANPAAKNAVNSVFAQAKNNISSINKSIAKWKDEKTLRINVTKANKNLNKILEKLREIVALAGTQMHLGITGSVPKVHVVTGAGGGGGPPSIPDIPTVPTAPTPSKVTPSNLQKAAINRLQYMQAPSLSRIPMMHMLNAYALYSVIQSQAQAAMEYKATMESVHSILKIGETDLDGFESKFASMSAHIRQIGLDTKFTANDVADAARTLGMAGLNLSTVQSAMKPIANLALIEGTGMKDVSEYASNILRAYSIKEESIGAMADILANTSVASNAELSGLGEAFKMSAGYLRLSGIDFSEASAAIGILGNSGMKGTMAGTAMRAMATRFAKPTKEAEDTLNRLGVKFTQVSNVAGKTVEKVRPLADIFQDLKESNASLADMIAIFGKIGGNAGMNFLQNYKQLRELTNKNKASYGMSSFLGDVQNQTTAALWQRTLNQFSDGFRQAFVSIEPVIRGKLKEFLELFQSKKFAYGIAELGRVLLNLFSIVSKIGVWFVDNLSWIGPIVIAGKLAISVTKLTTTIVALASAFGLFKSASVVSGVAGVVEGVTSTSSLLATTAQKGGLMGAIGTLASIGPGLAAGVVGISALIGVIGVLGYKMWETNQAKKALIEDTQKKGQFLFPSIEALTKSIREAKEEAINAKSAIDKLPGQTVKEMAGTSVYSFWNKGQRNVLTKEVIKNKANADASEIISEVIEKASQYTKIEEFESLKRHTIAKYMPVIDKSLFTLKSEKVHVPDGKSFKWKELNELTDQDKRYLQKNLDRLGLDSSFKKIDYNVNIDDKPTSVLQNTVDYDRIFRSTTIPAINTAVDAVMKMKLGRESAVKFAKQMGFDVEKITSDLGFSLNKKTGLYEQLPNIDKPTEKLLSFTDKTKVFQSVVEKQMAGSNSFIPDFFKNLGIPESIWSNEPNLYQQDSDTRVTNNGLSDEDGMGNSYSGTGKMESAAPKQVIVNITNLMSIETIELMGTSEGKSQAIQDLKGELTQLLLSTVHDFDASWNGNT